MKVYEIHTTVDCQYVAQIKFYHSYRISGNIDGVKFGGWSLNLQIKFCQYFKHLEFIDS